LILKAKLYNLQDTFLYHPDEPNESRKYMELPPKYDLFNYEVVKVKTSDNLALHCYFVKQSGSALSTAPTLVFVHGNAGNIGQRLVSKYSQNYYKKSF
jgi:hypothetical protein